MRLLIDNNLSPRLAEEPALAAWDVVHVRELGLQAAADEVVLAVAATQHRHLVSADTDFGQLLAATRSSSPPVVLIRRTSGRRVDQVAGLLSANLPALAADLEAGAAVVLGESSVRVRRLPLG